MEIENNKMNEGETTEWIPTICGSQHWESSKRPRDDLLCIQSETV